MGKALIRLAVACALLLGLSLFAIAIDSWPEDPTERWTVVQSVAATVVAAATVMGLATLAIIYAQTQDARQRFRVELGPYLRVDLSPAMAGGSWTPPSDEEITNKLTFTDVNPGSSPELGPLGHWLGNVDIYLWVHNMQAASAGVADDLTFQLSFDVPDEAGGGTVEVRYELTLAYLAAGQRVRYLVASVSNEIPRLTGRIERVRYTDLYGNRRGFAHGAAEFELDAGNLVNRRVIFREE